MNIDFELDESGNRIGRIAETVAAEVPDDREIRGELVRLERLTELHAHDLWRAFSATDSPLLWTYMPQGPFDDEPALRNWVKSVADSRDPLFYAVIDASSGQAVGVASYLRIDPGQGSIEVGYLTFSGALSRTPAATEAMYLMARNAFDRGFRRYEWKCNVLNAPSIAAATRLGFSFEGVFRNAAIVKGRNRDTAWFAITVEDWERGIRAAHERWLSRENFTETGEQITRLGDATQLFVQSTFPSVTVSFNQVKSP